MGEAKGDEGRVEDNRRMALLIGVGENPAAEHRLPSLAATVDADLRVLGTSLEESGYAVETLLNPTRNAITERIAELSASAPPDSTLLLYFTGHGIRVGTTDYLVPSDARAPAENNDNTAGWEQAHVRESLLEADISRYLVNCSAGTLLWLIDACRWTGDEHRTAFGSNVVKDPPHSGFAMMTSCSPGEPNPGCRRLGPVPARGRASGRQRAAVRLRPSRSWRPALRLAPLSTRWVPWR